MRKRFWALLCASALAQSYAFSACAQSQEYRPEGARAGGFVTKPNLELTTQYNSNIFREADDETSDLVTILTPSVLVESDWNRHSFSLDVGLDAGFYADSDDDDFIDGWALLDGELDATRATKIFISDIGYERAHEARGADEVPTDAAEPTVFSRLGGLIGVRRKPNRFGVEATARATSLDYEDTDLVGGGELDGSLRDRNEYEFALRAGYDIQAGYEAFAKAAYEIVDYDAETNAGGFDRDSDGYKIFGGMAFQPSPLTRADIGLGYQSRDYDDADLETVDGIFGSMDATWFATPLTTVTLGLSSRIEETTAADAAGKLLYEFTLGVEHELLRYVLLNAAAGYGHQDFDGAASDRQDDDISIDIGARYWLNRNFYAGAAYEFDFRDSSVSGEDYTVHQLGVMLGAQL